MKFKRSSFIKKVGVLLCFVAFALSANAQTRKVTGQIVDESGQPIIGATIRLQDATTGTITDIDGHFSLNVPDGKKVVISYIGYLKQVILPKGDTLKVILQEDNQKLDEVVVVGYGSMKQKNITGSVSTISAEELEDLPVSNLSEALQGMVNGLNVQLGSSRPGTNANEVYIRQNRTFTGISKDGGNSTPLIIIDDVIQLGTNGQPSMEQFNMLDPSEVESITVFTVDTGMTCVWGARYLQATGKRHMLGSFNHGSMANALPQAIGAALAYPDRQVVALCGDGGLSMTLGDLETVVQYKLPIKIIVFNNRSLGMVKLEMEVDGLPDWQTNMLNPDFAQVAEAMGMTGFNVSDPEEVLTTLLNAFELDGPVLVNIMTDPNALAMPPKIEFGQMVGFAQSMYKLLINGRSQEVIDTINSNFKHIREVF